MQAAHIEGVTPHVFRHTFASIARELGYSELSIAGLLGHGKRGVMQGYIHIDDLLRSAADVVAAKIAAVLDGKAAHCADTADGFPDATRSMRSARFWLADREITSAPRSRSLSIAKLPGGRCRSTMSSTHAARVMRSAVSFALAKSRRR